MNGPFLNIWWNIGNKFCKTYAMTYDTVQFTSFNAKANSIKESSSVDFSRFADDRRSTALGALSKKFAFVNRTNPFQNFLRLICKF